MEICIKWNVCRICLDDERPEHIDTPLQMKFLFKDAKILNEIYNITGVVLNPEDNFPEKICVQCLSMLRHAVSFRASCRRTDKYLRSVVKKTKSANELFQLDQQREKTLGLVGETLNDDLYQEEEESDKNSDTDFRNARRKKITRYKEMRKRTDEALRTFRKEEEDEEETEEASQSDGQSEAASLETNNLQETSEAADIYFEDVVYERHDIPEDADLERDDGDGEGDAISQETEKQLRAEGFSIQELFGEEVIDMEALGEDEERQKKETQNTKESIKDEFHLECVKEEDEVEGAIEEETETQIEFVKMDEAVIASSSKRPTAGRAGRKVGQRAITTGEARIRYTFTRRKPATSTSARAAGKAIATPRTATSSPTTDKTSSRKTKPATAAKSNNTTTATAPAKFSQVCELCGNSFTNRTIMNHHMRLHRNEKTFECELCGKRFNAACNLTAHMRTHTGEKPFACQYCDRRFTDRSTHIKHERVHTQEKPFECMYCNKSFSLSTSLKAHIRIHTGEKPFKCLPCERSFKLLHQFKAHLTTHMHKVATEELYAAEEI